MISNSLFPAMLMLILSGSCSQTSCNAQKQSSDKSQKVGGGCEGCEAIYESTVPFKLLKNVDTLPDFNERGPKLKISGTVYKADGKTPASNVVVYIYHTDQTGNYSRKGNEKGWGKRHGYIRGWVRTNGDGQYTFYTLRPAPYPGRNNPAHIHCVIKEENLNEYYIDEFLFADDPLVTDKERSQEHPGGNGIIQLQKQHEMLIGNRDIFLGRNIKNYPVSNGSSYISLMSFLVFSS